MVWDSAGKVAMEEGLAGVFIGGAAGAVALTFASRVFSITSARRLRVELRAFEIITGLRSLVLLFDDRLALGGHVPLADLPSCLRFRNWLLLPLAISLSVSRELKDPIEMSRR